nr:cation diffusion facilitator family transporter [Maliibacterium massiliense]
MLAENKKPRDGAAIARRVLYTTLTVNALLLCLKLAAGILAGSGAMVSDAVHTLSDVVTTVMVLIGLRLSRRPCDALHPFGHMRFESLTGLLLGLVLLASALGIGWGGVRSLLGPPRAQAPGILALIAAAVSILVQEGLFHYARWGAKAAHSTAMMADAWHHRSDALSSVGSLIGIGLARLGFARMDAVASLGICLAIAAVACKICRSALHQLVDEAAPPDTQRAVENIIRSTSGVIRIDSLRTRVCGNRLYVETEIALHCAMSFSQAHDICEQVHKSIERMLPEVLHCVVHANPCYSDGRPACLHHPEQPY